MLIRPYLTHLLGLGLALALPAFALACSAPVNDAPIIDSVDAPLVVSQQNGTYAIPVTVLFHDNDGETVSRLHYRLPPNIDGMIDVPAPNPTLESAQVTILIKASDLDTTPEDPNVSAKRDDANHAQDDRGHGNGNGHGTARAFRLSIVDDRGAESLPLSSTVTLN